jgi:hypothetical protein
MMVFFMEANIIHYSAFFAFPGGLIAHGIREEGVTAPKESDLMAGPDFVGHPVFRSFV